MKSEENDIFRIRGFKCITFVHPKKAEFFFVEPMMIDPF
jgi:hypothetical protein